MELPLFTKEVWYLCTLADGSSSCNDAPNLRYLTERKAIKDCTFFCRIQGISWQNVFFFQNIARISNYDIFDNWEFAACSQGSTIFFSDIDFYCKLCKVQTLKVTSKKAFLTYCSLLMTGVYLVIFWLVCDNLLWFAVKIDALEAMRWF